MGGVNPPLQGEGDRAAQRRGGGGVPEARRPVTYAARKLRRAMSLPEVLLWQHLRGGKTGLKFRRQHPIGPYIADFYCSGLRLVLEIDGETHNRGDGPQHDASRDAFMQDNGYRVMRFAAADVLKDVEAVVRSIVALGDSPLHHPSDGPPPRAGED